MSDEPLSAGQALRRWLIEVLTFLVAGGAAAGLSALAYQLIAGTKTPLAIYAVIFAASGLIAYRLADRVLDSPDT